MKKTKQKERIRTGLMLYCASIILTFAGFLVLLVYDLTMPGMGLIVCGWITYLPVLFRTCGVLIERINRTSEENRG